MSKRIKERKRHSTSQLLNFAQDSYLDRTSRPIYAIIFLLPFIIFYEVGTILIHTDVLNQSQVRVVAFVWLQNLLEYMGSSDKLAWVAPPVAVVVILVALQLSSRKPWGFGLGDLCPMGIECILLAVPLIVLSLFLNSPTGPQDDIGQFSDSAVRFHRTSCVRNDSKFGIHNTQYDKAVLSCSSVTRNSLLSAATDTGSSEVKSDSLLASIVTGIGAGIYEELVFRLILICVLMLLFQDVLRLSHKNSIILSVLVSAGLFSAHHHIVFVDGQLALSAAFNWTEFGFRTIAGIYFAVLFAIRGFGITAGTHAFYDIIATIINAAFFSSVN
jgi:membrane protease YdiL (CAAX protease family)